jgi:hypothetical protein|tara:strand:+ start:514 stop:864 length:351 start_codon:yes stop_codon:yes gene_type:complete
MEPDDESKCGEDIHTVGRTLLWSDDATSAISDIADWSASRTDAVTIFDKYRDDTNTSLIVGDRDVMKEIDELRDAVLLLKRAVDMEEKYPELKRLKDGYEAALDKYKTFDTIKDSK